MTIFKRILEDQIAEHVGKGKVLLIFGPRQVGKTTLSRTLLERFGSSDGYFNCEQLSVRSHFQLGDASALRSLVGSHRLVVFDEAQTVENIGAILKLFVDSYPDVQVIATGSSSFDLANKINEPLTGRAFAFTLLPLALKEIAGVRAVHEEDLYTLMRYGSYPAVVAAEHVDEKGRLLENIATSYLYKDVFAFERIKSPLHFEQLLKLLAHQVGSTVSTNELAQSIGVSRQTVEKYVRLLEQSFVIRRVHSFSRNKRNELRKSFKVYFVDTGIRNAIMNDVRPLTDRTDQGPLFEQFFFTELQKRTAYELFAPDIQFWRTKQGAEVDFILDRAGTVDAYECKWGAGEVSYRSFLTSYPQAETHTVRPGSLLCEVNP